MFEFACYKLKGAVKLSLYLCHKHNNAGCVPKWRKIDVEV